METEENDFNKNEIETKIKDLTFYRNMHLYMTGGYGLVTVCCFNEWIKNDFNLSELYIPIILGSICIMKNAFNITKKTNYKLKKMKTNLKLIEFKDNFFQKMESNKYLLKK